MKYQAVYFGKTSKPETNPKDQALCYIKYCNIFGIITNGLILGLNEYS